MKDQSQQNDCDSPAEHTSLVLKKGRKKDREEEDVIAPDHPGGGSGGTKGEGEWKGGQMNESLNQKVERTGRKEGSGKPEGGQEHAPASDGHEGCNERNGAEVEKKGGGRNPVEMEDEQRKCAHLSRQGKGEHGIHPKGKGGEGTVDRFKKEQDGEGGGIGQLKSDVEQLKGIEQ